MPPICPTNLRKSLTLAQRKFQYTTLAFVSGWRASLIHCELDSRSDLEAGETTKAVVLGAFLTANQYPGTSETS